MPGTPELASRVEDRTHDGVPGTDTLERSETRLRQSATRNLQSAIAPVVLLACLAGCAHRPPTRPTTAAEARPAVPGAVEKGIASWYGEPYHGRRTASGEVYDMHRLTAAHQSLPFGTVVRVTRRDSGRQVEVRINDRGPFVEGRIIDLSYAAARRIGLDIDGIAPVVVEVLDRRVVPEAAPMGAGPPPSGCWWVQVGAFADRDNARRAREALERSGEIAAVLVAAGGLSRVRVGPFEDRAPAERARERVLPEWPEAQVIPCGG